MNHPFSVLMPEYVKLLSTMQVLPAFAQRIDAQARKLCGPLYWPRFEQVQAATGVMGELIACLDYRESGNAPRAALGQGDPWGRVSTHVPAGHGPWGSWSEAAVFYVHFDHLDDHSTPWSWPYVCWKAEAWNGFGPRDHDIHTGYLWNGTAHYFKGKYRADHEWDAELKDEQLGVIPLMVRMCEIRGTLGALPGMPGKVQAPGGVPQQAPIGVGGAPVPSHDVKWLQAALNKAFLKEPNVLAIDGSYGRRTRTAVWQYQEARGLTVDGLFGPATDAALTRDMNNA